RNPSPRPSPNGRGGTAFSWRQSLLLKIIIDDAQIGQRRLLALHAGLDDAAADRGRRLVPEVVRCFQHRARGIERAAILLLRVGRPGHRAALAAEALPGGLA